MIEFGPVVMQRKPPGIQHHPSEPAQPFALHEYADLLPRMSDRDFAELKADVAERGIRRPIVLYEGAVLDGRSRYLAANDLQIEFPTVQYIGTDPLGFVVSENVKRRHLSDDQRRMVAAKLVTMSRGRPAAEKPANCGIKSEIGVAAAAVMANADVAGTERARTVLLNAAPELEQATSAGEVSVSTATVISALPIEEQVELVAAGPKAVKAKAKAIRDERAYLRPVVPVVEPEPDVFDELAAPARDPVSVLFDIDALMHELPDDAQAAVAEVDERVVRAFDTAHVRDTAAWLIRFADAVDAVRGDWS